MRVIKSGKTVKTWSAEFECSGLGFGMTGCHAILLVEVSDLLMDANGYTTFKCCECGQETSVSRQDIPAEILEQLWERGEDDGD